MIAEKIGKFLRQHSENYRWCDVGRSRFDTVRINVGLARSVMEVRTHYKDTIDLKVKIAPAISKTVYPDKP